MRGIGTADVAEQSLRHGKRSSTLSDRSGHRCNPHAHACKHQLQGLTLAFCGQVESRPQPVMRLILPKIHWLNKPGWRTNPTSGADPPLGCYQWARRGTGLAVRATVGGAVHEHVTADRRAAPAARLALAAVGLQRPVEVAALAVHVDVQRVEGRAAGLERLRQHVTDRLEQPGHLAALERLGRPGPVQPGVPQRLVGVDVADAADQGLVEQRALDPGMPPDQPFREVVRGRRPASSGSGAICAIGAGTSRSGAASAGSPSASPVLAGGGGHGGPGVPSLGGWLAPRGDTASGGRTCAGR